MLPLVDQWDPDPGSFSLTDHSFSMLKYETQKKVQQYIFFFNETTQNNVWILEEYLFVKQANTTFTMKMREK